MKVSSQHTLSHFHKITCLEEKTELRTRTITLAKIGKGREKKQEQSQRTDTGSD